MLRDTVRGFVTVASGLAEEVGKRVVLTAAELLERGGIDLAEVERKARAAGQFPPSVKSLQTLAEEAVTAGRAGFDLATGVARSEMEKAFEKVGDQVTKVGVVLAYLEGRLRDVEEEGVPERRPTDRNGAAAARADGLFGHGWEQDEQGGRGGEPIVAERVPVDDDLGGVQEPSPSEPSEDPSEERAEESPVEPAPGRKAAAKKSPAGNAAAKPAAGKPTPGKPAAAGKAAAKKASTGKKAPAGKPTTANEAAVPQKSVPQKSAKKAAVKKTTVAKASSATQPAPRKAAPAGGAAKRAATKRTTVRRSTSSKSPDA